MHCYIGIIFTQGVYWKLTKVKNDVQFLACTLYNNEKVGVCLIRWLCFFVTFFAPHLLLFLCHFLTNDRSL